MTENGYYENFIKIEKNEKMIFRKSYEKCNKFVI